jgi:hypothetical protein
VAVVPTIEITGSAAVLPDLPTSPGGDLVENTRNRTLIVLRNASGAPRTVTIDPQQTPTRPPDPPKRVYPEAATPSLVKVIPAGALFVLWALPAAYNDVNGKVHLTYDDTTNLTLSALVINTL